VGESQIPEDLRRFILLSIPSVPHLEALLLMRRDPQRSWNAAAMAQGLYIDEHSAAAVLAELAAGDLVVGDSAAATYRYAPPPPLAEMMDRLADLYARALVTVTNLIHGRSAQLFADAFKLRKD
jgi:hypothetical protein